MSESQNKNPFLKKQNKNGDSRFLAKIREEDLKAQQELQTLKAEYEAKDLEKAFNKIFSFDLNENNSQATQDLAEGIDILDQVVNSASKELYPEEKSKNSVWKMLWLFQDLLQQLLFKESSENKDEFKKSISIEKSKKKRSIASLMEFVKKLMSQRESILGKIKEEIELLEKKLLIEKDLKIRNVILERLQGLKAIQILLIIKLDQIIAYPFISGFNSAINRFSVGLLSVYASHALLSEALVKQYKATPNTADIEHEKYFGKELLKSGDNILQNKKLEGSDGYTTISKLNNQDSNYIAICLSFLRGMANMISYSLLEGKNLEQSKTSNDKNPLQSMWNMIADTAAKLVTDLMVVHALTRGDLREVTISEFRNRADQSCQALIHEIYRISVAEQVETSIRVDGVQCYGIIDGRNISH